MVSYTKLANYSVKLNNGKISQIGNNRSINDGKLKYSYFVVNILLLFGLVALAKGGIVDIVTWILTLIATKYAYYFIVFIPLIVIDFLAVVILGADPDILNMGILSIIIYLVLDFVLLSKELVDFSLIDTLH